MAIVDRSSEFSYSSEGSLNLSKKGISKLRLSDEADTDKIDSIISEGRHAASSEIRRTPQPPRLANGYRPGTSGEQAQRSDPKVLDKEFNKACAEELILKAERLKANINRPPGNIFAQGSNVLYSGCDDAFFQSIAHIDKSIRNKFTKGEAVDLVKLLPRNKYKNSEEHKMEITSKEGVSFYVPVKMSDREDASINSFKKWDKAFRVYAGIYTKAYPDRSWEM